MPLRVVVPTCDKYLWLVQPFTYLFNRYWSELQPVVVAGFSRPDFHLPPNFTFYQIAREDYPANKWSDGMIKLLQNLPDQHFILLLEDYFLCRTVDHTAVDSCYEYIKDKPEVLRIDLTADRLYAGGMFDLESYGRMDIIETPHGTPYQFSTQAGIWNRDRLLEILIPGRSAWESELYTPVPDTLRILGTRQYPVRYVNVMKSGQLQRAELDKLDPEHQEYLAKQGWFSRNA
jgi:hypothetical protein